MLLASLVVLSSVIVRPAPVEKPEPCSKWRGTVSGNDPSVAITATLCRNKTRVTGTLHWSSDRSGTNTRKVEGTWSNNAVTLRDVSLTGTPKPGWVFCKIDRYDLTASTDALSGAYHSAECNDNATVSLARVR